MDAKSSQERDLDACIAEVFPHDLVLREHAIKAGRHTLFVDRLLPNRMVAIEVDGKQHFQYSHHFHKSAEGYRDSMTRDKRKVEWLDLNGYALVRFRYDEKITTTLLRERVLKAMTDDNS